MIDDNRTETDSKNIDDIMSQYPRVENDPKANFEIVNKILMKHYRHASIEVLNEIFDKHLKDHYRLDTNSLRMIKVFIKEIVEVKPEKPEKVEQPLFEVEPTVEPIEGGGLFAVMEYKGKTLSVETVYTGEGNKNKWETKLLLDGKVVITEKHKKGMNEHDTARDKALAIGLWTKMGDVDKSKYKIFLEPIYTFISAISEHKEILDEIEEKHQEDIEKQEAEVNAKKEEVKVEREAKVNSLYDIIHNVSGNCTIEEIRKARNKLRRTLMPDFWRVEGRDPSKSRKGYLKLQLLPIVRYLREIFHIIRYAGNIWYYDYEKGYYAYDNYNETISAEINKIMKKVGDGKLYSYNGNVKHDMRNIIDLAAASNPKSENPFNKYKNLINFRNGVLEIDYKNHEKKMLGKKPDYMFSYCIDTIYDKNVSSAEIDEMLDAILDPVQRDIIYQIAALAIQDTDPDLSPSKVAYIFFGKQDTGESIVLNLLNKFFGKSIVTHISLREIAHNKYVKPMLEGKLINLDGEMPSVLYNSETREIKSLTGGKFHTIEPKYCNPYEAIITALLVFSGKNLPRCGIKKDQEAFWARWDIVKFTNEFIVNDKFESEKFTDANMSGFLNGVINKLFELYDRAKEGKRIIRQYNKDQVFEEWMQNSSTVYRFIQDKSLRVELPIDYPMDTLYARYNNYCESQGIPIEDRVSKAVFGKELANKCGAHKIHIGTNKYVHRMFREFRRCWVDFPCYEDTPEDHEGAFNSLMPENLEEPTIVTEDDDGAFNAVPKSEVTKKCQQQEQHEPKEREVDIDW